MSDSEPSITSLPSRRRLLQGATACSLPIAPLTGAMDPATAVAQRFTDLEQKQRRLGVAWQDVETWLFKHRSWPQLTAEQQASVPEAAQLRSIEVELHAVSDEYDGLLPLLTATPARTREGVIARFEALLGLLNPYDNGDAYALLRSCLTDLHRVWR